jgi:ketose-bisphosphate aldolase
LLAEADWEELMPLASMVQLLADAGRGGYALCYCESWNLESVQAVIEAAEDLNSPSIVGFNGGFLLHPSRSRPENLAFYAGVRLAICQSRVPIAFLLNETDNLSQISLALELGFNAVMVEGHHMELKDYRGLVQKVVAMAHAQDVFVEGQVGSLPDGWKGYNGERGQMTDPELAKSFVDETGIDALSVSIGNVHVLTSGKAPVNMDVLRRIREQVPLPLVIHGGTGFPSERAADVIKLGVAKFNFGTALKQAYLAAIREKLALYHEPMNPHRFLGMGGREDLMVAGKEAVKQKVKELIQKYGFAGKSPWTLQA